MDLDRQYEEERVTFSPKNCLDWIKGGGAKKF